MGVPVLDYPNYIVEADGRVYSKYTNKYLKYNYNTNGYASVELFKNGKSKRLLVHRLVAQAYLPNPDNLPQINHKDENPKNNDLSNLEWCTSKYNMNYGNGAKTRHSKINYNNPVFKRIAYDAAMVTRKPILQYTKDGTFIKRYDSIESAMRELNLKHSHISECAKGKRVSSNGFVWKYERGSDL